jgi:hypothetical protein
LTRPGDLLRRPEPLYLRDMRSVKLLLENDLRRAAEGVCSALRCELTVVDAEPLWHQQSKRVVQVDMTDFHYRMLEELGVITGSSPEALLLSWIQVFAGEPSGIEAEKVRQRCRLIVEWQSEGFTGGESDLRHFAERLATV